MIGLLTLACVAIFGMALVPGVESTDDDDESATPDQPNDNTEFVTSSGLLEVDTGDDNILFGTSANDILDPKVSKSDVSSYVFGDEGDDVLIGRNGDKLIGGLGVDEFEVTKGDIVHILDYEDGEQIVLKSFDPNSTLDAKVDDGGVTLLIDDIAVAYLHNVYTFDFSTVRVENKGL